MLQATRRPLTETAAVAAPRWREQDWLGLASRLLLIVAALLLLAVLLRVGQQWRTASMITQLQIEGELHHVDRAELQSRLRPLLRGNYFSQDLQTLQAAASSLPWVEEVRVSRRWPDGVRVHVREKQVVALWGAGGLISARGVLFVPGAVSSEVAALTELPVLSGPAGKTQYVMEQYRAMNSILRSLDMHIVELQLSDRMSWFLRLDNGIRLVVDQVDTIEKMQRFAYLYEQQLKSDAANIASIDLRYRNGVAVGWKQGVITVPQA